MYKLYDWYHEKSMDMNDAIEYLKARPNKNKVTLYSWNSATGGTYLMYDTIKDKFISYSYNTLDTSNIDMEATSSMFKLFATEREWYKFPMSCCLQNFAKAKYKELIEFLAYKNFIFTDINFPDKMTRDTFEIIFENHSLKFLDGFQHYSSIEEAGRNDEGYFVIKLKGDLNTNNFVADRYFYLHCNLYGRDSNIRCFDSTELAEICDGTQYLEEVYKELLEKFSNIRDKKENKK